MANHHLSLVFRMEMHGTSKAVLEHLAVGARALFHPSTVAEGLEAVFPNIEEVVLIDIALHIAAVNIGASGDGAVNQDRTDGDASAAEIIPVADLALIGTDIGLATEHAIDFPLFSGRHDEIHHLAELLVTELQAIVISSAANRSDGEQTPCLYLVHDEQLLDGLQFAEIHRTDASDDIVCGKTLFVGNQVDGTEGVVEAALAFAEGVMGVAQTIQADGDAAHSSLHQFLVHRLVVGIAVADDAPWKAVLPKLSTAVSQVRAHQRLTTSNDNENRIAFIFRFQWLNRVQKILEGHVLVSRRGQTIRATMLAIEVAALRAFPKKVVQLVELGFLLAEIIMEGLEHYSLLSNLIIRFQASWSRIKVSKV